MRKLVAVLLAIAFGQLTVWAGSDHVIVELSSWAPAGAVAAAVGGEIERSIAGTNFYLMKVPSAAVFNQAAPLGVLGAELDNDVSVHPTAWFLILKMPASKPAEWYSQQPAMKLVNADKAAAISKGRSIVIADINSRVDYGHPALIGHLTAGYDFVAGQTANGASLNQSNASFLDQSNASFIDQSNASFLDQSTAGFLDQSNASFLDQSNASFLDASNPAHGHGTFCAGILAALAPDAMIMPLRAFDDNGNADAFTIAQAIRYAVQHGANVINMSFGMDAEYKVVKDAVQFATDHGVDVVASAGNENGTISPACLGTILSRSARCARRLAAFHSPPRPVPPGGICRHHGVQQGHEGQSGRPEPSEPVQPQHRQEAGHFLAELAQRLPRAQPAAEIARRPRWPGRLRRPPAAAGRATAGLQVPASSTGEYRSCV